MAEQLSEYLVIEYVDDLEEATSSAEKHEMIDVTKGLKSLHGDLVELGNVVDSEDKIKRLKADVEQPLQDLLKCCQEGEEGKARGTMRTLRDKVHTLKALWGA
jgi:hypothetical protein